jgi:excisionase family DNA binding protein
MAIMRSYTKEEAAEILRYSTHTIQTMLSDGTLKGFRKKPNGRWRIKAEELERFMEGGEDNGNISD